VGFSVDPPAYPTRVRRTPGRLPNRESGPQNQPKAKVAVSVTPGREASIGGTAALRGAVPFPVLPVIAVPSNSVRWNAVMSPGTGASENAATDPAANNPKRLVLLLLQKESVVFFTGVPFSVSSPLPPAVTFFRGTG